MIIPFAPWRPDDRILGNGASRAIKNAIPHVGGYRAIGGLNRYSSNALDAYCRGAYYIRSSATGMLAGDERHIYARSGTTWSKRGKAPFDAVTGALLTDGGGHYVEMSTPQSGDLANFADGDLIAVEGSTSNDGNYVVMGTPTANKLYITGSWVVNESAGTIALLTVRQRYETGSTDRWSFAQWADTFIATNYANFPQATVENGHWEDLTTALRFRYLAVVKDFLVVGDTNDTTDGARAYRVRWCAQGDPTDWTVSASTLADYNDMVGPGGDVTGVVGGEYGIVFQEAAITRMTFVGSPLVFQFDRVSDQIGCQAPGSIIKVGETIYFWSTNGFMALDAGSTLRPIGYGKVDITFANDVDTSGIHLMSAAEIPQSQAIVWAYRSTSGSGNKCDKLIIYSPATGEWATADTEAQLVVTVPKTSQVEPVLAGFDSSNYLAFYETTGEGGTTMQAELETAEFEIAPGARGMIKSVRPLVRDSSPSCFVLVRDKHAQAGLYTTETASTILSTGRFAVRSSGRYGVVRIKTSTSWTDAAGVDVEAVARGRR